MSFFLATLLYAAAQEIVDPDLDAADKLWVEFQMPMLSPDSKPIVVRRHEHDSLGYEEVIFGFTHPKGAGDGKALIGSDILTFDADPYIVSWEPPLLRGIAIQIVGSGSKFYYDPAVCEAIEADLAGHRVFAELLADKEHQRTGSWDYDYFGKPTPDSLEARAAYQVATALANRLLEPNSDRTAILRQLQELDAKNLVIPGKHFGLKSLIERLKATVETPPATSDPVEIAIDRLCDATGIQVEGFQSHEVDPAVQAIVKMGSAAVPALTKHFNDPRLTRSIFPGMDFRPTQILWVGYACESIVERIKGTYDSPRGG